MNPRVTRDWEGYGSGYLSGLAAPGSQLEASCGGQHCAPGDGAGGGKGPCSEPTLSQQKWDASPFAFWKLQLSSLRRSHLHYLQSTYSGLGSLLEPKNTRRAVGMLTNRKPIDLMPCNGFYRSGASQASLPRVARVATPGMVCCFEVHLRPEGGC